MDTNQLRRTFLEYFRDRGHEIVPSSPLVPGNRSHPAVHQRGHGPVQGRVPRHRPAALRSGGHRATLCPRGWQAQRPGERRLHGAPPHVLRDARQLQLRRLLQARRHPLLLGIPDRRARAPAREAVGDGVRGRRRGGPDLVRRDRDRPGPILALRREGQLLGDGRHRTLRTMLRGVLRPRTRGAGRAAGKSRRGRRPLHRAVEPRVHAVQPRRLRTHGTAAQALRGYRTGAGARRRGSPGECTATTRSTCS